MHACIDKNNGHKLNVIASQPSCSLSRILMPSCSVFFMICILPALYYSSHLCRPTRILSCIVVRRRLLDRGPNLSSKTETLLRHFCGEKMSSAVKASIVSSKKDAAYAAKVNQQMASICPELASKYAQYPLEGYSSWLKFDDNIDGKPAFIAASQDEGLKENYVWCKVGIKGKGYYHLLTKVSYTNLYNRVGNSPPGGCCGGTKEEMAAWETTKMYLYNRSRAPRPDDAAGAKASIDHMEGSKLNPVHGITG